MRAKTLTCILLGLSFVLSCGSTKDGPGKTVEPANGTGTVEVEDREGFSVKGVVLADGAPVAGAMVSDGVNVTQTDFDGKYWLRSTSGEDVVWLSVPSGYEVTVANGWTPQFWRRIDQKKLAAGEVQRFDFSLKAVNQERFALCVFTDTHIRGRKELSGVATVGGMVDSTQFRTYFLPKVQNWDKDHAGVPHYGLVLGDMIQDYAVKTFKILNASGVCRIDFMMDEETKKVYVNEINTIPGSLAFYLWEESGVSFSELMDRLVRQAIDRQRRREKMTYSYDVNILSSFAQGGAKGKAKGK